MNTIKISDMTMKQGQKAVSLSFKEKIELAKQLDKLGVSVIELEGIENMRIDSLRIKSIAAAVTGSIVAVPVELNESSVSAVWSALYLAKRPRLQVCAPASSVQMEYLFHKKPDAMVKAVSETVARCAALCNDVEFIADDATRSDPTFLNKLIEAAIAAGATTVTLCDTAGTMLPEEFGKFVESVVSTVPALENITLGVACSNTLSMADACIVAALQKGAKEAKTAAYPVNAPSLANICNLLAARGDSFGIACPVPVTQLNRTVEQIKWLCSAGKNKNSAFTGTQEDTGIFLSANEDITAVLKVVEQLGYDLSREDGARVYDAFRDIASKKEQVSAKELEAIIASAAMQVPATYILDNYVITSGNTISSSAMLKLKKGGQTLEGVSTGDGPIDAAFLAIEKITGRHYELDDFQIQSVTEGREAMGQTVVKLRWEGKLYSGRGISTDIVGASIYAYLSAINKIVYEEDEV